MPNPALSTNEIQAIFAEEISVAGGVIPDVFDDGTRLFGRSILPWVADVRPGDQMKSGVAIKAAEDEICVHPYLFRTVCSNGAIMAHAFEARRIENSFILSGEAVGEELREAVHACSAEEAFAAAAQDVRLSVNSRVDLALTMMPLISRVPPNVAGEVFGRVFARFFEEPDRSRFSLMNAVTSVARDTSDPELRWRLEELGGAIGAGKTPTTSPFNPSAALAGEWGNLPELGGVSDSIDNEISGLPQFANCQ